MRTSEQTDALSSAMAKAWAKLTDPVADAKNSHFGSTYAKLSAGTTVIRPALASEGLSYSQGIGKSEALGHVMITRITHASGQWQETDYPIAISAKPQAMASANTYARRHALFAAVGVAPDDDDGEGAHERAPTYDEGRKDEALRIIEQLNAPAAPGYHGASFAAKLKGEGVGHTLEQVKRFCLWLGRSKPSQMDAGAREKLIAYLASDKGAASWDDYEAACG